MKVNYTKRRADIQVLAAKNGLYTLYTFVIYRRYMVIHISIQWMYTLYIQELGQNPKMKVT